MNSIWMLDGAPTPYPPLQGTVGTDVVVIGGGITGVATALCLYDAGKRVVLLEASVIGAGNTGRSTGNLYGTLSSGLAPLRERWGDAVLRRVAAMRMQAVQSVEDTVARFSIDCDFARRPLHVGLGASASAQQTTALNDEFEALGAAGLSPVWIDAAPPPVPMRRGVRIEQQAQFNPYRYTRGLAAALSERGVQLYEHSAAVEIDAGEGCVRTAHGEVRADCIVFATHTPKGFNLVQAEMEVYREYGIAAAVAGAVPDGIFWLRDNSLSLRSARGGGRGFLVAIGQKHKTGHPAESPDPYRQLLDRIHEPFAIDSAAYRWSAQQYRSADGLPYAGVSAHRNVFIATGFGADGLTWGTASASVIAELVQDRESERSELLAPRRFTPARSARVWTSENVTVLRHLIGDRLSPAERQTLAAVEPGQGHVVELGGDKFAVHRDDDGRLTVLTPVCPHLKCHVAWNPHARSWDCPCHGSRFGVDGRVLEGPALEPLRRYETSEDPV